MFHTLDDLKGKGKKKDDKKTTNAFVGGTDSSLAVENPDDVDKIVQRAQEDMKNETDLGRDGTKLTITLWKNGFQVDEGEFREYDSPENK